jgi:hypothetical protein
MASLMISSTHTVLIFLIVSDFLLKSVFYESVWHAGVVSCAT